MKIRRISLGTVPLNVNPSFFNYAHKTYPRNTNDQNFHKMETSISLRGKNQNTWLSNETSIISLKSSTLHKYQLAIMSHLIKEKNWYFIFYFQLFWKRYNIRCTPTIVPYRGMIHASNLSGSLKVSLENSALLFEIT